MVETPWKKELARIIKKQKLGKRITAGELALLKSLDNDTIEMENDTCNALTHNNTMSDKVNHPSHYGGDVPYEVIKVLEAWEKMFPSLTWNRLTAIKYIPRAGEKDKAKEIEDLEKAIWYLQRDVAKLKVE